MNKVECQTRNMNQVRKSVSVLNVCPMIPKSLALGCWPCVVLSSDSGLLLTSGCLHRLLVQGDASSPNVFLASKYLEKFIHVSQQLDQCQRGFREAGSCTYAQITRSFTCVDFCCFFLTTERRGILLSSFSIFSANVPGGAALSCGCGHSRR